MKQPVASERTRGMATAFDHGTIVRQNGEMIGKLGKKEIREQRSENEGLTGERRIYFGGGGLTRSGDAPRGSGKAGCPEPL